MKLELAISALGAAGVSGVDANAEGDHLRGLANRNNGDVCETPVRDWTYNEGTAKKCFLPIPEDYGDGTNNKCLNVAGSVLEDIDDQLGLDVSQKRIPCKLAIETGRGQTGVDVTCDSQGELPAWDDNVPNTDPTLDGLNPINIHFHLGAEHKSYGEYDPDFHSRGPSEEYVPEHLRGEVGKRCSFYDANDERFNPALNDFKWEHCVNVTVGETYEFHWPNTAVGTDEPGLQYQGSFPDGLLCEADQTTIDAIADNGPQALADTFAVQGQVFTVIDDDEYDIDADELIAGMIVNEDRGVEGTPNMMGKQLSFYTGSRSGGDFGSSAKDPLGCDPISPVSWHVDRKCHLISARSMDAWCEAVTNLGRGMVRCDDDYCLGMPLRAVFKNPLVSEDNPGEYCCYPTIRTGSARNVNDGTLANANREHFMPAGEDCEQEIEDVIKKLGDSGISSHSKLKLHWAGQQD